MNTGFQKLYYNRGSYCRFSILYEECKWYEFARKRILKDQLDWIYPLMKGEVNNLN